MSAETTTNFKKVAFVMLVLAVFSMLGHTVAYGYVTSTRFGERYSRFIESRDVKKAEFSETVAGAVARFQFNRDLWLGERSELVRELQEQLRLRGFFTYPMSTSYYGSLTADAVSAYQLANGLPVTGIFNTQTRELLNSNLSGPVLPIHNPVLLSQTASVLGGTSLLINNIQSGTNNGSISGEQSLSLLGSIGTLLSKIRSLF
jgi:hypothetical protein